MKIVHLCPSAPYNDNWGYQDNLLPLYHMKLGHEVTVIATNTMHGPEGSVVMTDKGDYHLANGLHIIRRQIRPLVNTKVGRAFSYLWVSDLLLSLRPDFIMIHGLVSITAWQAIKYKKREHPGCIIVADSHQDDYNSPTKNTLKNRAFRAGLRLMNGIFTKHYARIFGVTPECIDYAVKRHWVAGERFELLPLGCDTDRIRGEDREEVRPRIIRQYGLQSTDFVVVSGGKLDEAKNTHSLIEAVGETLGHNVKLVIFGSVSDGYRTHVMNLMDKYRGRVVYAGFLDLGQIYDLFLTADLAVFPGSQSALWQQAIACGVPTVFKKWPNIGYLDVGGNCIFLEKAGSREIKEVIEHLSSNREKIGQMREVARVKGFERFSYRGIAEKVLG